ncbi:uncharacterized protein [Populus alba]|uniref:uncharacterized protein isoform X1 n=1 Tax=Populus alba TaxID=43335 RepID=UPI003CC6F5FB
MTNSNNTDLFDSFFRRADLDGDGQISGAEAVGFFQGSGLPTHVLAQVEELEKEILDSRQKIEFYSVKMQELILYKSRCDNRLNEVTARVSTDKHEAGNLESRKLQLIGMKVGTSLTTKVRIHICQRAHLGCTKCCSFSKTKNFISKRNNFHR